MKEQEEKYYISAMAVRKREFFEKHLRATDNEWMLQEMEEFGDEVHICAEAAFKHKKMTKKEFQETVTAARDEWFNLYKKVKEYEEQAEYLARLTGQISFND